MESAQDRMREAGKVQNDPALAAIQELGDQMSTSVEVLERGVKAAREEAATLVKSVRDSVDQTRTELAAGFKAHSERINALDRRQVAIGGFGRDVEGCCLAALGEEEKKDIPQLSWMLAGKPKDERTPMLSSPVGSAMVAHWFQASMRIQKGKFNSQAEQAACYDRLERYEKALIDAYNLERAAAFSTTDAMGGHWIPDPVAQELYRLIADNSIIMQLATHVPMTAKTLDLPVEGSSALSVSWGSESTTITDSAPANNAVGKVTLTASRINGRAVASIESLQDAAISILVWVQQKLTELMGTDIDKQALEGTGSPFTGLSGTSGVNEFAAGANGDALTYAILSRIPYKARHRASRKNARWALAPEVMAKVVGLADSQGMPVFQFSNVPNAVPAMILGYPVEVHSGILANRTKGTSTTGSHIYFGPFDQMVIGDRMGMSWDVSDLPGFSTADVHMRLLARLGFGVAVPAAFTRQLDIITA